MLAQLHMILTLSGESFREAEPTQIAITTMVLENTIIIENTII